MKSSETPAFELPADQQITDMLVERINETSLRPDTPVICINRGRKVLEDMFDGTQVPLPVGYFRTEYGAAQHFQRRLIVPGTRNLEVGGFVSYIGIIGPDDRRLRVDAPEMCVAFTDEELQSFGEKIEGLDRGALGEDVQVIRVAQARAGAIGQGVGGLRPQIKADQQASEAATEAAEHVFEPPVENFARQAEAEARADAGRGGRSRPR